MTTEEAIKILSNYNKWRRGAEIPQPDPKELGLAIDFAVKKMKSLTLLTKLIKENIDRREAFNKGKLKEYVKKRNK